MIEIIRNWYNNLKLKSQISLMKEKNLAVACKFDDDKELKKYSQSLKNISQELNELFYENSKKSSVQLQFIQLSTLRIQDYYRSILIETFNQHYHSVALLVRALCESLYLLKYVEKNPDYLDTFMKKEGRGKKISEMRNFVKDSQMDDFYDKMSEFIHPNPAGFKFTYYRCTDCKHVIISDTPFQTKKVEDFFISSTISLMQECIDILKEIKTNQGKKEE